MFKKVGSSITITLRVKDDTPRRADWGWFITNNLDGPHMRDYYCSYTQMSATSKEATGREWETAQWLHRDSFVSPANRLVQNLDSGFGVSGFEAIKQQIDNVKDEVHATELHWLYDRACQSGIRNSGEVKSLKKQLEANGGRRLSGAGPAPTVMVNQSHGKCGALQRIIRKRLRARAIKAASPALSTFSFCFRTGIATYYAYRVQNRPPVLYQSDHMLLLTLVGQEPLGAPQPCADRLGRGAGGQPRILVLWRRHRPPALPSLARVLHGVLG